MKCPYVKRCFGIGCDAVFKDTYDSDYCTSCQTAYRKERLHRRQDVPKETHLYCPICSEHYTKEHEGKCERRHTLIEYPPPKLTPTEAVAVQLEATKGGATYVGSVYGYGHADRLLEWARKQDLLKQDGEGDKVTKAGEKWLAKNPATGKVKDIADSKVEQSERLEKLRKEREERK